MIYVAVVAIASRIAGVSKEGRLRRRVEPESEHRAARRGCLRIAAILGIIVGIPTGVFGIPAAFNYSVDHETVGAGVTYDGNDLRITVTVVTMDEGPPRSVVVTLSVDTDTTWAPSLDHFELELVTGDRIDAVASDPGSLVFDGGREMELTIMFPLTWTQTAPPRALYLAPPFTWKPPFIHTISFELMGGSP